MATEANRIYKPVRQAQDIRQVLGVKGGLGRLCTSSKINERAAHKPTNFRSHSALTEAERRSTNYSTWVGIYYNPFDLISEVVAGRAWGYDKPQAPYYRQGDLDGYWHDAGDWFTVKDDTVAIDRALVLDASGNGDALSMDANALYDLIQLGYLSQYGPTDINFGFLMKQSPFTESVRSCYYIPLTGDLTIRDIADNGRIAIPANSFELEGTWYLLPCITTAKYPQGKVVYLNWEYAVGDVWLPILYSHISTVEVTGEAKDYPVDLYISIVLNNATVSMTDRGIVTLSDVDALISNSDTMTEYKVVISEASISSGVIGNKVVLQGGSATVPANGSAIANIQSGQIQFEVADSSIERIGIDIEYYVSGDTSHRRTAVLYVYFQ